MRGKCIFRDDLGGVDGSTFGGAEVTPVDTDEAVCSDATGIVGAFTCSGAADTESNGDGCASVTGA